MYCALTIARYPKYKAVFGLLSMAIFRWFLFRNKKTGFYKLMGCGKGGAFDIRPDIQQWAVLVTTGERTTDPALLYGKFITGWWQRCRCELFTILMQPTEGHGLWDGKACFGPLPRQTDEEGITAVLTRATIRLSKLKAFWKNVPAASAPLSGAAGLVMSVGIGETPWIKQATFSVWESKQLMKNYAYGMKQHTAVIGKTRKEAWYSEEMFVRFKVLSATGSLNGSNPLAGYFS